MGAEPSPDNGKWHRLFDKLVKARFVSLLSKPWGYTKRVIVPVALLAVAGFLYAVGGHVFDWVKGQFQSGQARPRFAIVGPGETDQGYVDWKPALQAIRNYLDSDSNPAILELLEKIEMSDNGDEKRVRQIAKELCADSSVVAVIGYVWSTVAKPALEVYGGQECAGGRLPVILVGATADDLTEANETEWTLPVLQVAPSNALQARAIAEALGDTYSAQQSPRALVFRDKNNPKYATPLAGQINKAVGEYKKAQPSWQSSDYGDETWESLGRPSEDFDVVIFVGNNDSAATFLRELPTKRTHPIVIVTDGSVNDALLNVPQAECVWGTFPATNGKGARSPDFSDFGLNAVRLLETMALNVKNHVTRGAISQEFKRLVSSNRPETVAGQRFLFDYRGRIADYAPKQAQFFSTLYHFHRVQRSEDGALRWVHREQRSSLNSRCGSGG